MILVSIDGRRQLATEVDQLRRGRKEGNLAPNRLEKGLAVMSVAMLLAVLVSLAKGAAEWGRLPDLVWFHLATIAIALGLTPLILLRRRGDKWHRRTGYVWAAAIMTTALATFWIRGINPGRLSLIHLLSGFTLLMVPIVIFCARRHRIRARRIGIQSAVAGALLIAGFFTLVPGRILGDGLLG